MDNKRDDPAKWGFKDEYPLCLTIFRGLCEFVGGYVSCESWEAYVTWWVTLVGPSKFHQAKLVGRCLSILNFRALMALLGAWPSMAEFISFGFIWNSAGVVVQAPCTPPWRALRTWNVGRKFLRSHGPGI